MEETNPILWQCGHILGFYYKFITTNLKNLENLLISECPKELLEFYDSYLTPNKLRYNKNNLLDINIIIKIFIDLYSKLKEFITKNDLDYIDKYLIFLGILHTDMHIEALHFSGKYFNYGFLEEMIISNNKLLEIEFIEIPEREFIQGYVNEKEILSFDNERPSFKQDIKKFSVSKYPITQHQFMDFIRNGGYFKREYWSDKGWSWKREKLINYPLYYKDYNDNNLPIYHISYYEAEAFCKMFKYRLLYEKEWEYLSTNGGETLYPWGNEMDINKCNLDYSNQVLEVDNENKNNTNKWDVVGLIGNIWEWCEDSIYPYDGFKIDPIYREMSYPYFGFKKICRGGCFNVPNYLIHSKYRNAQYPDCRIQYIGFRVVKDF
jgi:iron(II)-dependent oxidoreductase